MAVIQNLTPVGHFFVIVALLFVPAYFQSVDYGMWGEWGERSECSRTCGSGVSHRTRKCHHGIPGVSRGCQGKDIKYESCNTQPCTSGLESFRAVQCSRFNDKPVEVKGQAAFYTWEPYVDGVNQCALVCKAKESGTVKILQDRVVDGTDCDTFDTYGICLGGVCQEVGCDRRIGSTLSEDKCRVCGGNGEACQTMTDVFNTQKLIVGEHNIITFPAGTTSIDITQMSPSLSTLVLKSRDGVTHIDGKLSAPDNSVFNAAGARFKYLKTTSGDLVQESITSLGPTNDTLHLKLLYRDKNPGIKYEFSIPISRVLQANPEQRFVWMHGSWTGCSAECGEGFQLRAVSCIDRSSGGSVPDKSCNITERPESNKTCSIKQCGTADNWYRWVPGHWGPCSVDCGIGEQSQVMYCVETGANGDTVYVKEDLCDRYAEKHPLYKRACEGQSDDCPYWATTPWGECSVTCGYGTQARDVFCQQDPSDPTSVPEAVDNSHCTEEAPESHMTCKLDPCPDGSNNQILVEVEESEEISCLDSRFGCCPDQVTPAEGFKGEGCNSSPRPDIDVCRLEPERGPCSDYSIKWHFVPQETKCRRFWYGGCQGNENRFDTEESCEARCLQNDVTAKNEPIGDCTLRVYGCCPDGVTPARGANQEGCDGVTERNSTTNLCRRSSYGCCQDGVTAAIGPNQQGCSGTDGNLVIRPDVRGGCRQTRYGCCPDGVTASRGQNQEGCKTDVRLQKLCEQSYYGCCPNSAVAASGPNFEGCTSGDFDQAQCSSPEDRGSCSNYVVQWRFDVVTSSCRRFWYGGCGGNNNRFATEEECTMKCVNVIGNVGDTSTSVKLCTATRYGCCPDGRTTATGPDNKGCGEPCESSQYGCCEDGVTFAQGRNKEGCEEEGSGFADCKTSKFGCCPDKVTAASGPHGKGCVTAKPDTDDKDVKKTDKNKCLQPSDRGTCTEYAVKWYYDKDRQECAQFWYGGCHGNDNRFESRDDCEAECISSETATSTEDPDFVSICDMPQEPGPCRGLLTRWFYNPLDRQCRMFIYGGCQGNENNFISLQVCQQTCIGAIPTAAPSFVTTTTAAPYTIAPPLSSSIAMTGSDRLKAGEELRLTCHAEGPQTPQDIEWFINGKRIGRQQEDLTIRSYATPSEHRFTSELIVTRSQANNSATYYCRSIPYGTLDKKSVVVYSQFITVAPTQRTFTPIPPTQRPFTPIPPTQRPQEKESSDPKIVCKMPQDRGKCKGYITRWFFDDADQKCRQFTYGGCDGNSNNFESMEACQAFCRVEESQPGADSNDPNVVCQLPAKVGNCRSLLPRWYYDSLQGLCRRFDYGGCSGNSNNFMSEEACNNFCRAEDICKQPQTVGICLASFTRYYYDSALGECRVFVYGGCDGNLNNFASMEACQRKCYQERRVQPPLPPAGREVCNLDPDGGNCQGYNIVWYYDNAFKRCQRFVYTGCSGNGNRFSSEQECVNRCSTRDRVTPLPATTASVQAAQKLNPELHADVCSLPRERGPCSNYNIWWFYDAERDVCTRFYYGGCGGNANRFTTQDACEQRCVRQQTEIVTTASTTTTTSVPRRGCSYSRFGCCEDNIIPKADSVGSNCLAAVDTDAVKSGDDGTVVLATRGSRAVFDCFFPGRAVTWYRDGYYLTSDSRFIIYNNGTLVVRNIADDVTGNYACRISDGNNIPQVKRYDLQLRTRASTGVRVPLSILQTPPRIRVVPGENAYLHCQAMGTPSPRVSWSFQRSPVRSGDRIIIFNNGTLVVTSVTQRDTGVYECTADNGVDTPVSRQTEMIILESITAKILPHSTHVTEGGTAQLECVVSGYPPPSMFWEKDGVEVTDSSKMYAQGNKLYITRVSIEDTGLYACVATSKTGRARDATTLQVKLQNHRDGQCSDAMEPMKCRLIVTGRLCGHRMFAGKCCRSCRRAGFL